MKKILRRWDLILFVLAVAVIYSAAFFAWGYLASLKGVFPQAIVHDVGEAAKAYWKKLQIEMKLGDENRPLHERSNSWYPRGNAAADSGVVAHKQGACYPGYTVYADAASAAYLIDLDGTVLHTWRKPFNDAWPDPPHMLTSNDEPFDYWHRVHVYPNGDLLAIYHVENLSPYAGGLVRLDRDSNVLWTLDRNAHHDLDIAADGTIYVLTQHDLSEGPRTEDYVMMVAPGDGAIIDSINIADAIRRSDYTGIIPRNPTQDFLHTNNLEILDVRIAGEYPMFEAGDILLSFRALSGIAILDPDTRAITWYKGNLSVWQHDPDFVGDGKIVLFDNLGVPLEGQRRASRIVEYDLNTLELRVLYQDTTGFFSDVRGSQQLLANGNLLITSSAQGRVFEVDVDGGGIVWEFITPQQTKRSIGVVNSALRFAPEDLPFLTTPAG
ncbi:MAG: hypothetical protein MAG453_01030 [Calditrichaeota bacterium]|nr:hypothetical protein [Calditrichota bacterium]